MRATSTCPKCRCRKLFVAVDAQQPDQDNSNGTHPLTVTCAYVPTGALELLAKHPHAKVRLVDGEASEGPFR